MERIQLSNSEFEGDNSAYLFEGERTALVDTGVATADTREQLLVGLRDRGVAPADLDAIYLTHWHPDHAGLAGELQRRSGADVRVHVADAGLVAGDPSALRALVEARGRRLREWGMPADRQEGLEAFIAASPQGAGEPAEVDPLADGERVRAGDELLRAVHTPGHTEGHCVFVKEGLAGDGTAGGTADADGESEAAPDAQGDGDVAGRTVLSGDALLPEYTPNVGGADPRVEGALGKYVGSLTWLADAGFVRAHPGHRDPIEDPAARAREIIAHHRERAGRVLAYLREAGAADPWTVSAHLFGSLSDIHVLHGPGEAFAHLEHMHRRGVLERDGRQYRLLDGDADLDALFL